MTASIADLVAGCDRLARQVAGSPPAAERSPALLAAWPRLAAAAVRVLDELPLAPEWETARLRWTLQRLVDGRTALPRLVGIPEDARVREMSRRLGAVADLLVDVPQAVVASEVEAARQLRAVAMAPVFAVARVTAASLRLDGAPQGLAWRFRVVAGLTERAAMSPPGQLVGHYGDVAAIRPGEASLDAVIAGWARATVDSLAHRQSVTGTSLLSAAGDAAILTAAATTTVTAAADLGLLDQAVAGAAVSTPCSPRGTA